MPNDVDVNRLTLTYTDFSTERSTTSVNIASLADNAAYLAALTTLENAIDAVINGNQHKRQASLDALLSNAPGAAGSSREYKLLVRYEDSVNFKLGTFTIPTFDISTVTLIPGTDRVDFSAPGVALDLVNAIEDFVVSVDGNGVTVLDLVSVGRNL